MSSPSKCIAESLGAYYSVFQSVLVPCACRILRRVNRKNLILSESGCTFVGQGIPDLLNAGMGMYSCPRQAFIDLGPLTLRDIRQ